MTSTTPSNRAAWLLSAKDKLIVQEAPYTPPTASQLTIKTHALALSFVDWAMQATGMIPLTYPTIIGNDIAGEVVEVGSELTGRFKKGDRVLAHAPFAMGSNASPEGAFQEYVVALPQLTAHIPADLAYERAATMPLAITTAAAGLFEEGNLGLAHPSLNPKSQDKTLLVWGGASSVGCNAVQLAVAAGYDVVTTASGRNVDLMKRLGARAVIDYTSAGAVDEVVAAITGKTHVGAFETSGKPEALLACADVLLKLDGGRRFIASVQRLPEGIPSGVTANFYLATTIRDNGIGKLIYETFLPDALAKGAYIPAPEPKIVGKGLEKVQDALDTIMTSGVSAQKLVITL